MLRLSGGQVESLFDVGLPVEVRELPEDLAALDLLLGDPALLEPISAAWDAAGRVHGRPTIPMDRYVRLMVVKQRSGWGLRRWCARCLYRCICGGSV
jgi:MoaA/NifB/PqqE/SkfB family radical SAM enzyme